MLSSCGSCIGMRTLFLRVHFKMKIKKRKISLCNFVRLSNAVVILIMWLTERAYQFSHSIWMWILLFNLHRLLYRLNFDRTKCSQMMRELESVDTVSNWLEQFKAIKLWPSNLMMQQLFGWGPHRPRAQFILTKHFNWLANRMIVCTT